LTGWRKIIVDLSECEFIDSTFLGALVVSLKKVTGLGGDLRLVGFQPAVHSMFELTRMYRVFESFKTKDEALKSFE
jgi:anti-anti-sigma factor